MAGPVYTRRQPEKTALFQVVQQHLLTFEQEWTDQGSGRTLPKFVTDELQRYVSCGILGRGFGVYAPTAMHLVPSGPHAASPRPSPPYILQLYPARQPPRTHSAVDDWVNWSRRSQQDLAETGRRSHSPNLRANQVFTTWVSNA